MRHCTDAAVVGGNVICDFFCAWHVVHTSQLVRAFNEGLSTCNAEYRAPEFAEMILAWIKGGYRSA